MLYVCETGRDNDGTMLEINDGGIDKWFEGSSVGFSDDLYSKLSLSSMEGSIDVTVLGNKDLSVGKEEDDLWGN